MFESHQRQAESSGTRHARRGMAKAARKRCLGCMWRAGWVWMLYLGFLDRPGQKRTKKLPGAMVIPRGGSMCMHQARGHAQKGESQGEAGAGAPSHNRETSFIPFQRENGNHALNSSTNSVVLKMFRVYIPFLPFALYIRQGEGFQKKRRQFPRDLQQGFHCRTTSQRGIF